MGDADFQLAEEQRDFLFEHQRRPGQAGHGLDAGEQAREALDLGLHVGLAALDDHFPRAAAGDDLLRAFGEVGRCAQHAHRVVVRQHHVLDGLVGDGADARDQVLRHRRGGGGVDDQHAIVADHDAGIGIALGGVRPGVLGQLGKSNLLGFEVGLGCECLGHGVFLCVGRQDGACMRQLRRSTGAGGTGCLAPFLWVFHAVVPACCDGVVQS
ncbi:hypothetical protein D3C72_1674810 [compost metagenome]